MDSYFNFYDVINPYVPVEILKYLTIMSIVNPDVCQAVKNWVNIGNTGHKVIISDKQTRRVDLAIDRINEKAYHLY